MRKILQKLFKAKPVPAVRLEVMKEGAVNAQVRHTLRMARDFYQQRGRTILAVDLNNYLNAFDEAIGFDRLENVPVLLPTDKNRN